MAEVVEKLSRADIVQQYQSNLVFYKGHPVFVNRVTEDSKCQIVDIRTGERSHVSFNLNDFKAPVARLGMLNINNSVVYLSRIPVRRMNIGLNNENLVIQLLPVNYPDKGYDIIDQVRGLRDKAFADMFDNKYPSLEEALKQSSKNDGARAFDKQFAVDHKGNVFYKTKKVGSAKGCTQVKDIVFDKDFSYLSLLLDGNYEKTVGISCS